MTLYHVTYRWRIPSILLHGLVPGRKSRFDETPWEPNWECIYLTSDWRSCAWRVNSKTERVVVIDTEQLDLSLFRPDEDYLYKSCGIHLWKARETKTLDKHADKWKASLDTHRTVAYKGTIPVSAIVAVEVPNVRGSSGTVHPAVAEEHSIKE